MSSLKLRKKQSNARRINLSGIVPDRLLNLSLAEIATFPIVVDDVRSALKNEFEIVDGDRHKLLLLGDLSHCDCVGGGMQSGVLEVASSVGDYLANDLKSGQITVNGNAGGYAGSSMRGGLVEILGDVGEYAAAAAPHRRRGMNGGTMVIHGNAGPWLANRMRRGLVVVRGDVGVGCASRMIAGTVAIEGAVELPLGYSMSRGTVVLMGEQSAPLTGNIAGFTEPAACELSFMTILLREVATHVSVDCAATLLTSRWMRCLGDRAEQGIGEVMLRVKSLAQHADRVSHA